MTSSQLASLTIFTSVKVTLIVAGFVKIGNRRTVQDIPGCHRPWRPAVHCCVAEVSSNIQSKFHSPAEWACCRVTDSSANERTMRADFAAHGRPGLSYRSTTGLLQWDSLQSSLVHIAHAKQIKPAEATAKLAQNSALSARREKGICIVFKKQIGTHREKACVNTYAASASQICLQNICGQQQNFPMASPTFGSKSGPQNGAHAKT